MLELQHVSFEVNEDGSGKEILRDISLTIPTGNLTVITG
ncbi:MAG TPA: ABC transporter ATP-binding protein, partial [Clostridiales bacterium]|nr:ABC transporter ATP-binding protein [Clostridiales bacterium]